jgi:nicotinic acid mononucleotide adenylyltransferase
MAKTYKELVAEALNSKRVADISLAFNRTAKPFNSNTEIWSSYNSETVDTVESFNEKVNKNIEKTTEKIIAERVEEQKKEK